MERSVPLLLLGVWAFSSLSQQSVEMNEQCPERILGNERSQTCLKKCQQDKDCGTKRQCLCDGECGLSCVNPGRMCPWPLSPGDHFEMLLLYSSPSFSALLEVRCHPGYTMAGGLAAIIRRCQGDQQWSGNEPVCTGQNMKAETGSGVFCPLPSNELLYVSGSAAVGSTIQYHCAPGHMLVGFSENVCQENQTWQFPHSICQSVFCLPPVEVKHGYLVAVQKSKYNVGDSIYYLCKKTFLLDGPNQVTCQSDGTWSTVPFCRARCPIPAQRSRVIVDGVKRWPHELADGLVTHGENVTFFCKHPHKYCSLTATETCFDGHLLAPDCYIDPTWLQYQLYPHRLVSEIDPCDPDDLL